VCYTRLMGDAADDLSNLIGEIYDTTLDAALWDQTLKKAARFVGGPNAWLCSNGTDEASDSASHVGFDPCYTQAYLDEYRRMDPTAKTHFVAAIGKPVALSALVPKHELFESRFYCEWLRPQGLIDCIQLTVDKTGTTLALFGVSRRKRDGVADKQACQRMRLLAPHLRRAVSVAKVMGTTQARASALAETFDGLRAGMFLVDRNGRIIHANVAGHSMMAEGNILSAIGGRLFIQEARSNRQLSGIFTAAGDGDAALGAAGVTLPLTARSGQHYVAHVLPLTSGLRNRAAKTYSAVAALFVHSAKAASPSAPETIAKVFRLTPSELNVLLAIVEVGGVPDVAEALGIAPSTVRTHLNRVYEKTGVARQADLVKLVAQFSNSVIS
jgi:DNA-binding CsgD family transcriptional regulator/PAS domain-containing protein